MWSESVDARIDATTGLQMSQPRPVPYRAISAENVRICVARTISNNSARDCSKCSHSAFDIGTPELLSSCLTVGRHPPQVVPALVHALTCAMSQAPSAIAPQIAPLVTPLHEHTSASSGRAVRIPVTVKCRIGIDDQDSEADFERFITTVADAGCRDFTVHARKAWLLGLSPKENREIPPLDYARVWRLKSAHPELTIAINGGIAGIEAGLEQLQHVDGVMIGRAAYQTPWLLAELAQALWQTPLPERIQVLRGLRAYVESRLAAGDRLPMIVRHWLGIAHGLHGGRTFRRILTEDARAPGAGWPVVEQALAALRPELAEAA